MTFALVALPLHLSLAACFVLSNARVIPEFSHSEILTNSKEIHAFWIEVTIWAKTAFLSKFAEFLDLARRLFLKINR
jgi:hypothetical protein